jgi:hypothetical protein
VTGRPRARTGFAPVRAVQASLQGTRRFVDSDDSESAPVGDRVGISPICRHCNTLAGSTRRSRQGVRSGRMARALLTAAVLLREHSDRSVGLARQATGSVPASPSLSHFRSEHLAPWRLQGYAPFLAALLEVPYVICRRLPQLAAAAIGLGHGREQYTGLMDLAQWMGQGPQGPKKQQCMRSGPIAHIMPQPGPQVETRRKGIGTCPLWAL